MARAKPATTGKCPICGRATETDYRPFCSRRCADVDLSRWLIGAYAIPARPDDDEDGERPDPAQDTKKDDPSPPTQ